MILTETVAESWISSIPRIDDFAAQPLERHNVARDDAIPTQLSEQKALFIETRAVTKHLV